MLSHYDLYLSAKLTTGPFTFNSTNSQIQIIKANAKDINVFFMNKSLASTFSCNSCMD